MIQYFKLGFGALHVCFSSPSFSFTFGSTELSPPPPADSSEKSPNEAGGETSQQHSCVNNQKVNNNLEVTMDGACLGS